MDRPAALLRRFEILETLGEGGTGAVYRARERSSGREVALKVLAGEGAAALAGAEFRFLASHDHPGLVRVFDHGTAGGRPWFTMELCRGEDLLAWARRHAPAPPERLADPRLLDALGQLLEALDFVHTRGVAHRDLKPENVLVAEGPDGRPRVRLVDFGLAGAAAPGSPSEAPSGTVDYLAPERLRGAPGDARADLWSLGVLLYELAADRPPFPGDEPAAVIGAVLAGAPPGLPATAPDAWRETVAALLAAEPRDRPRSAHETARRLLGPEARSVLRPSFTARLVGRDEVLERVAPTDGPPPPGVVLLRGPTGIGKSRILRETRVRLQLAGLEPAATAGRAGTDAPGGALDRLLAELAATAPGEREARAAGELRSALRHSPGGEGPDPAELRESFASRFAVWVFERAAAAPVALLVDDAQDLDSLSLEALRLLTRRLALAVEAARPPRIAVVLAARDDDAPGREAADALAGLPGVESRPLRSLETEELERYLRTLLGETGAFPRDLPSRLHEATGGNPWHVEECLRLLAGSGRIRRTAGGWELDAEGELPLPSTLEETEAQRVAELSAPVRAALEWVALRARPVTPDELARALEGVPDEPLPSSRPAVEEALAAAAREHLFRRSGRRYALPHAALGAALRGRMPPEAARRRHRRWAGVLLDRADGDPETAPEVEALAHHLWEAGERRDARPWLLEAARRAQQAGALREAARALDHAVEASEDDTARAEALLRREEVLAQLGDPGRRRADLDALGALAGDSGDAALRREVLVREALWLDARGEKPEALATLRRARELPVEDPLAEARLLDRTGMIAMFLAEREESARSLGRALEIARQEGSRPLEAESLQLLGLDAYLRGAYDEAVARMGEALALRRALEDRYRAGSIESNLGLIQLDRGRIQAAEDRFDAALEEFRRPGHRRGEAASLAGLGLAAAAAGRFERALDALARALEVRRELGDEHGEGSDLGNLGGVWLRIGRPERARPLLERALELARRSGNRASESVNLARLARLHLDQGDSGEAREHAGGAEEAAQAAGGATQRLIAATTSARVALHGSDAEAALAALEPAVETARARGLEAGIVEALALRAEAHRTRGDAEAAEADAAAAVEALEALPGPLDAGPEAWLVRARVLEDRRTLGLPGDDPAGAVDRAYAALREQADAFEDADLRRSFLEGSGVHREIDRRHDALRERLRRDTGLRERSFYEIAHGIHSIRELDPLLDRLLRLAIETTRADKGLVLLRDAGGRLTIRAAHGMPQESVEDATQICQSVIEDVARGGEPVLAVDAPSDDRFRARQSIISYRIRTLMCVPLETRGEVLGAVYVDGRGAGSFATEDLDWLLSFARLAAVAVDNVRLVERLRAENRDLRREMEERFGPDGLVAASPAMRATLALARKVARTDASVLITGETGTGKSLLARALHSESERRSGPFVTVDCGALPESLLESELFGHRRGAFSGALHDRVGLVEEAAGGTLFLDEITNTSVDLQAKLLRVLQEGEVRRLGENRPRHIDVRVITATNADLRAAVQRGTFREDLYWRLHVVALDVPPLRERREDIPPLVERFLREIAGRLERPVPELPEDALDVLVEAPWPGNIRELENLLEKAVILAERPFLSAAYIRDLLSPEGMLGDGRDEASPERSPAPATGGRSRVPEPGGDPLPSLEEFDRRWREAERDYLLQLIHAADWNVSAAARTARVRNRNRLVSRLKKHGIDRPEGAE